MAATFAMSPPQPLESADDNVAPDLRLASGRQVLVDRYGDALYRWAWVRAKDADTAQEVVQRSFLTAFERPEGYDRARGEPWGWLVGLAMNHLKSLRRDLGRTMVLDTDPPASGTAHPFEDAEIRLKVREALTGLDPGIQALLEGHYLAGKPVERLAQDLGVAPSTAWARLASAREALRKALKETGACDL